MFESKNCTNTTTVSANPLRRSALAAGVALVAGAMASPTFAGVEFESDNGWKAGFNGHIPIFAVLGDFDDADEDTFSITTGFNPATLQTNVYAPSQNGIEVSGHFQMNTNITAGDPGSDFRSRVAEIAVAGDFGTVNIGKGFGIYGVPAIGDNGSGLGVGLIPGGPDQGAATNGRIGNGYFYANFTPRVMYTSNNMGGLQFKVGFFDPIKPGADVETTTPRIEANVVYSTDMFSLWTSGFTQDVDSKTAAFDDFTMTGIDFGGSVSLGGLGLRANYGVTQGTGSIVVGGIDGSAAAAQEEDADQWYVESTYDFGRTTLGASYGEGEYDLKGADEPDESELTMLFGRYAATDALTLMLEYQDYQDEGGFGDYSAIIVGSQLTF